MVMRLILIFGASIGLTSLSAFAAEAQFHCAHCAILASSMADEPGEGLSPKRQYAPDRTIDVEHLKLRIVPDFDTQELEGVATMDFAPIAKPLKQLRLDARDLRIEKIESAHPVAAFQMTGDGLEITFVDEIPAGTTSQVTITYEAAPKKGLYFRSAAMGYPEGDEQLWTQGEPEHHRYWYPSYDYPNEKFTTEVICQVPEGMVALSNGKLVSQETDEAAGHTTFHWLQDKVHVNYLVSLVAGRFEKIEDTHGELPIALYVPPSKAAVAPNTFRDTKKILEYFEEEIGVPYPWDKYYNVCAIDYMMGGMENTSLTTLTTRTLFPSEVENLRSSRSLDAHEAAHQWFGDLVTCRDWSHIWLNEGFATYYSLLYDRHLLGDDFFKLGLYRNAQGIFRHDKDIIPMVYRGYDDPMEQFSFRAYPKGAWVLHMLRTELGEDLFRQCVKTYLERHAYKTVVTQDVIEIFEEFSGRSLSRFFDQWVYLSGYPALKVSYSWDELSKQVKLTVSQTQMKDEKRALFRFPLPIRFKHGEEVREETIEIAREREDFYFEFSAAPDIVRIDPEVTVLAKVDFTPPEKLLLAQLDDESDALGRLQAVPALARKKSAAVVEKLSAVLNEDPFFAVREAAAEGLGSIRSAEAFVALRDSLRQEDARVRLAVTSEVRKFYSGDAFNVLKSIADQEANPDIQTVAVRELGKYAKPELRPYFLELLAGESYEHEVAGAAIRAMRSQDDPYYVEPLRRTLEQDEAKFTSRGFSSALVTLGRLARDQESKAEVRTFLMQHVDHLKREVARSAMRALGELGDPKAIPLLESYTAADADSPDGMAAQRALEEIQRKERPQAPEQVNRLQGEVDDLRAQLNQVNSDIKALRAQFKEAQAAKHAPSQEAATK